MQNSTARYKSRLASLVSGPLYLVPTCDLSGPIEVRAEKLRVWLLNL